MARHTGEKWFYDIPSKNIVATGGVSPRPIATMINARPGVSRLNEGSLDANGYLMASALELSVTLGDLLEAAAPLLGEDDARIKAAREIISSIVQERLR